MVATMAMANSTRTSMPMMLTIEVDGMDTSQWGSMDVVTVWEPGQLHEADPEQGERAQGGDDGGHPAVGHDGAVDGAQAGAQGHAAARSTMMGLTSPAPDSAVPMTYATRPTMAPTDRSTLRVSSTSTWPTATVAMMDAPVVMLVKVRGDR